ncbi:MAG: ribosomal L7Ae/L30e/S12e/Gadd45 family protein [Lachnospiraceae bacterium]|nr:ribosomal L7Ae/L30e/S12e/Gadd45 family protein [Lachnospiraceae bacterium]
MKNDKVLQVLSLAMKAGRIVSGETAVLNAIRNGSASLVIIASDASQGTSKKFTDKSTYYEVPYRIYGTKELLAHSIGREIRSVIAVCDEGFAGSVLKRLEEADINGK